MSMRSWRRSRGSGISCPEFEGQGVTDFDSRPCGVGSAPDSGEDLAAMAMSVAA